MLKPKLDTLPEWELGYIAGILDGEGSITMAYASTTGVYSPVITVSNTNRFMLETLLAETLLGGVYKKADKRRKSKNYKQGWAWHLGSVEDIHSLLSKVTKYMLVKRPEAELLLECCANRLAGERYDELYYHRIHKLRER